MASGQRCPGGVPYRKLWMNLYRTHRDSTGWHGDLIGKVQKTST